MSRLSSLSSILGLDDTKAGALEALVDWSASDPCPVFWSLGGRDDLPNSLREVGDELIESVPQRYHDRACRYYGDVASAGDDLCWRALGFLIEDGRALRFREVLTGSAPDPLRPVYESAGVQPDPEGLIHSSLMTRRRGKCELGDFDVEFSRTLPASNSTYWLAPLVLPRPSCRVRLDPLRFASRGRLSRMFYAMVVYGPPFSWDRIMALRNTEAVQWMADDGEHVDADLLTELVWKPRGAEIILEVEELPRTERAAIDGARYLHAVLDRERGTFTHLDGAIRWYEPNERELRSKTRLDRVGAVGIRTKVFRLDEEIERTEALDILSAFFVWNNDVVGYFDPSSPFAKASRRRQPATEN